ncbi:unnamed protein product [Acanthoscelides obtectus]|uniref:HMG box domain-containing protein n=1 Tax=Acanthoscelides obtectus TaxID=200917 RepID=A0A9P0JKB6_ACAOB|nr:unnamed protein product [Acanthoscelides obtectus]CAK1625065.1 hypothetical protein AOBTE_LOCUS2925 [Acanthoscelides obtectus]
MTRKRQASGGSPGYDRSKPNNRKCNQYKSGKVTINPFLNFVRDVRIKSEGLSVCEIARKAGRLWHRMSQEQKRPYYQMARKARRENVREKREVRKEKSRRERGTSSSDDSYSCADRPLTRSHSQRTIRPRTARSSKSMYRSRSRPKI